MSYDFLVPLSGPLETQILMFKTQSVLKELLRVEELDTIHFVTTQGETLASDVPNLVDSSSGVIFVHYSNEIRAELSALELSDNEFDNRLVGCISFAYRSYLNPIIAVSCAIAMAMTAKSVIEDPALRLGKDFEYKPEEIVNALKCKIEHTKVEEALLEVFNNIESRRACKTEFI